MTIPLGVIVRDKVTGFIGVAENKATFMYGCARYCVQPKIDKDGKVPESVMIDEPQLEVVTNEDRVMIAVSEPEQLVKMGCVVTDPIRGIEGTVIGRAIYLNGCSRLLVQPKQVIRHEEESWWVDEQQVVKKKTLTGKDKITKEPNRSEFSTVTDSLGGPAPSSSKY